MTDKKTFGTKVKERIQSLTEGAVFLVDNVERLAIVIISRIAPWAAPLAPAYLVAKTVQKHFDTPIAIAVAVGVTLEAVGIASTHITLEMYQYNQTKRKSDPEAPFSVGMLVTSVYFIVGFSLTVLLEVVPNLVIIAPAAFFLLAIVAYITLALMSGHARRVQSIDQEKQERNTARRNKSGTQPEQDWAEPSSATRERAMQILAERPGISGSELGRQLGRSERLGRRLKTELETELPTNGNEPAPEPISDEIS